MGQKVSPIGLRVGVIRDWESRWFAEKDYADLLLEDVKIREYLFKELKSAQVSKVEIERTKSRVDVIIKTAMPGMVIGGNGGENVEKLKKALVKLTNGKNVFIKVLEIANPYLDAKLVARNIADQLENRASFRTAQKRAIQQTMRAGAKGIKTMVSGRLGGADMARSEGYSEGNVPLHTLRADIDYAWEEAATTYGRLGVKVWICRGEVLPGQMVQEPEAPKADMRDRRRGGRNNRGGRNDNRNNNRNRNAQQAKPATAAAPAPAKTEGGN
ncbi:small subunit ribosomal protein S3 [Breznakia blatticola]|uniref:Small ribosomal subunit protein uS3 n=1 Tax=Breznakia blatticola TaxID=1754012 RepID=A0A4R8A936_9FIRM|nr:30S ribosomal protein S3 [Breznakia blatticola]OCN03492.1 30S ribosomal protein S3 [Erysipelotrichaceae bacterium MTC7]TDW24870.1 small subunit ribosomal protein S3 [Breznakia blatticola]